MSLSFPGNKQAHESDEVCWENKSSRSSTLSNYDTCEEESLHKTSQSLSTSLESSYFGRLRDSAKICTMDAQSQTDLHVERENYPEDAKMTTYPLTNLCLKSSGPLDPNENNRSDSSDGLPPAGSIIVISPPPTRPGKAVPPPPPKRSSSLTPSPSTNAIPRAPPPPRGSSKLTPPFSPASLTTLPLHLNSPDLFVSDSLAEPLPSLHSKFALLWSLQPNSEALLNAKNK